MAKIKEKILECDVVIRRPPPGPGLYCNATWDDLMCWDYTEAGTMAVQSCPNYMNGMNPAGFATRMCLENGTWQANLKYNNTDGWTNFSDCLGGDKQPQKPDYSHHFARIQIMSEIGYGLSLASLIIAVLIMICSKRLHCKSNILHINLFCAFILRASVTLIKNVLFVEDLGLEKDITRMPGGRIVFNEEGSHWECKLIVTVLVYSLSASLMWILMEGLYLFLLVYKTLFTDRHGTRFYILLGWLSPFTFVIPWIFVRIFEDNILCWNLNQNDKYIWIIRAPLSASVLINFVFFITIVRVLCVRAKITRHVKSDARHVRKTAKFVLVLIPLFGVIYIAFSAYPPGMGIHADIIYLYGEMFYNSFQGFLLALLFCFLNEEVHNEIRRCWYSRRSSGFSTRSMLLASWKKNSRTSRADTLTRGTHIYDNGKSDVRTNSCKINKHCHEHVSWRSSNRDGSKESNKSSCSWKSEDCAGVVVVNNLSDTSPIANV